MPVNIVDADTFDSPLTSVIDGENVNAAALLASATQGLANRTRNLANRLGSLDGSNEWEYRDETGTPILKPRIVYLSPFIASQGQAGGGASTSAWFSTDVLKLISNANLAEAHLDITDHLPTGNTLLSVGVMVKPAVNRASGLRMVATLFTVDDLATFPAALSSTVIAAAVQSTGVNVNQFINLIPAATLINRGSKRVVVLLKAGSDGGSNQDHFFGVRLGYNEPGPRGH